MKPYSFKSNARRAVRALLTLKLTLAFAAPLLAEGEWIVEAVIARQNMIRSVDCSIDQLVYEKSGTARYSGRYRADDKGRFRIDYTFPSPQTVLNTKNGIFWHMRNDNVLYIISPGESAPVPGLPEIIKKLERRLETRYLGTHMHGFFTLAHRFSLTDNEAGMKMDFITGARDHVILEKTVRDREGNEIIREIYDGYKTINDARFPHRIDVFARSEDGVTRSITRYRDVSINGVIPDSVFVLRVTRGVSRRVYGR